MTSLPTRNRAAVAAGAAGLALAGAIAYCTLSDGCLAGLFAAKPQPPTVQQPPQGEYAMASTPAPARTGRSVEYADLASFDQIVLESDVPVLVDFYADWCGPCQRLAPALEQLAAETPHAKIVKVNIDDNPELAARYRVEAIPALKVFKGGRVTGEVVGLASKKQLKALIAR